MSINIKSVHEGQKFQCHICLKKFNRKSNLNKHLINVHGIKTQLLASATVIPPVLPIIAAVVPDEIDQPTDIVMEDDVIEALADFENQCKKLYYYYKT
jgi:Zinc finger, C2H2 type